jgi:hypothetical protein
MRTPRAIWDLAVAIVKRPDKTTGFVLLYRRCVVEHAVRQDRDHTPRQGEMGWADSTRDAGGPSRRVTQSSANFAQRLAKEG